MLTGGLRLEGPYNFSSPVLKSLERRIDGLFAPDRHDGPAYVIEFQGQPAPGAWYNLLAKVGLYGEEHPEDDVRGLLIYLRERDRPSRPRRRGDCGLVREVVLERVLPEWLAREPDNPFVAALAPLVIADETVLKAQAPALWRTVERAALPPAHRERLAEVLEFWFFERFRGLTAKEIWAMLDFVTPIQETRAYQSIFAEGKEEGKAEGKAEGLAEAKANTLKRQLARRFGALPAWVEERIGAASTAQLDFWLDGIFDVDSVEGLIGPAEDETSL